MGTAAVINIPTESSSRPPTAGQPSYSNLNGGGGGGGGGAGFAGFFLETGDLTLALALTLALTFAATALFPLALAPALPPVEGGLALPPPPPRTGVVGTAVLSDGPAVKMSGAVLDTFVGRERGKCSLDVDDTIDFVHTRASACVWRRGGGEGHTSVRGLPTKTNSRRRHP